MQLLYLLTLLGFLVVGAYLVVRQVSSAVQMSLVPALIGLLHTTASIGCCTQPQAEHAAERWCLPIQQLCMLTRDLSLGCQVAKACARA